MNQRLNNHAVEAQELTKQFDSFTAVDQISFTIPRGQIFGFLVVGVTQAYRWYGYCLGLRHRETV
jgi:ABC-type uncharacterized transport system ATPase subunit